MKTEHLYELLFEAVKTGTIDAVRKASSDIFEAPVFITDTSFRVLSADPDPGSKADMLEKHDSLLYVSSSLLHEFQEHHLLESFVSRAHDVILVNWGWFQDHPHITTGIFYGQKILGSITVLVHDETITDEMKNALLQCADACAIILHDSKEGRKHLQARDHFASQIFRGYVSSEAVQQAIRRGIFRECPHYIVFASDFSPDISWEIILQDQEGCLLYHNNGITHILAPLSSDISRYTDWVVSREHRIGCSFPFSELSCCSLMAKQAELALSFQGQSEPQKIIDFQKSSLSILMHQDENTVFIHPVIQEMKQYDENSHTDYVHTLSVWLDEHMDDSAAAEQLHIHRNTLYYRLKRITDLFQLNLDDMNTCVQLYLSLIQ